jgi:hypothetical protein
VGRIGQHANRVAALDERANEHELGRPIAGRIEASRRKPTPPFRHGSAHSTP